MSTTATIPTHYRLHCLPFESGKRSRKSPSYKWRYSRPEGSPKLTKEEVWMMAAPFGQFLSDGQAAWDNLNIPSISATQRLPLWRGTMGLLASSRGMKARRFPGPGKAGGSYDCTLHESKDSFPRLTSNSVSAKSQSEVFEDLPRFYQVRAPWAVLRTVFKLSGSRANPGVSFHIGSHFYAPNEDLKRYRDALRSAISSSPTARAHALVYGHANEQWLEAIGILATDEMANEAAASRAVEPATGMVGFHMPPSIEGGPYSKAFTAIDTVISRLRSSHPILRDLSFDIYTSQDVHEAAMSWMKHSADEGGVESARG